MAVLALRLSAHQNRVSELHSATVGEDAQGEASMRALVDDVEYSGHGLSTDIVASCAEALIEIADPRHREELTRAAKERKLLP